MTNDDKVSMSEFEFFEIFERGVVLRESFGEKKRISPFFS
jgi:hypothetical protein